MEGEKKRKRAADQVNGVGDRRRTEDEVAAQPTEDEVEEFFTILRRMNVAVKYFEKSGSSTDGVSGDRGRKMTEFDEAAGVNNGVKIEEGSKKSGVEVENGGLDLNAFPEAET